MKFCNNFWVCVRWYILLFLLYYKYEEKEKINRDIDNLKDLKIKLQNRGIKRWVDVFKNKIIIFI